MKQEAALRHEVIFAGVGGKGVLLAGQLLAQAAATRYEHVSYFHTYGMQQRSGASECTVILSHEEIASQVIDRAEAVVVLEPSQLKFFKKRVKPEGILLVESAGLAELEDDVGKDDSEVLKIPAAEVARGLGGLQAANFVLLGAYVELTRAIPPDLVERECDTRFGKEVLILNKAAFREGMRLASILLNSAAHAG